MIKMTRLRLINWHNFQDDTIDFKNITYLLGVNAVGKTTIMDAIRYCLTTNKDFNTAGNKRVEGPFWDLFIRNREQRTVICAPDTLFHILVLNLGMKRLTRHL